MRCTNARYRIAANANAVMGRTGTRGVLRFPGDIGGSELIVVVTVAVQYAVPDEDALAEVGTQVTAAPMLEVPLANCTVPVGPTPLLLVFTCAVSVTGALE